MRSIVAGASWWDATATAQIHTFIDKNTHDLPAPEITLTPREREILSLIATNKTDREVAESLYITQGTVRVHVHTILHKLGVADRHQAVAISIQHNLISSPRS
jgi:two-component system, NarL family, response regulator